MRNPLYLQELQNFLKLSLTQFAKLNRLQKRIDAIKHLLLTPVLVYCNRGLELHKMGLFLAYLVFDYDYPVTLNP